MASLTGLESGSIFSTHDFNQITSGEVHAEDAIVAKSRLDQRKKCANFIRNFHPPNSFSYIYRFAYNFSIVFIEVFVSE